MSQVADALEDSQVWGRQEGEPERHYEWFHFYLMMGPKRSLLGAYNGYQAQQSPKKAQLGPIRPHKNKSPAGAWKLAFRTWQWGERAGAYDAEQWRLEELEWEERKRSVKQTAWLLSLKMFAKVEGMLQFPLQQTTSSKDGKTITIEPAGWTLHTAARMGREANTMARLACGMETERVMREVEDMDEDELRAEAIALLLAEGYEVTKRENGDVTFQDKAGQPGKSQPPIDPGQAKAYLQSLGWFVLPPTPTHEA